MAKAAETVVAVSERLVVEAGGLPTAKLGAAALALALGRLCGSAGIDLEAAILLAKVARGEADMVRYLAALRPAILEEVLS